METTTFGMNESQWEKYVTWRASLPLRTDDRVRIEFTFTKKNGEVTIRVKCQVSDQAFELGVMDKSHKPTFDLDDENFAIQKARHTEFIEASPGADIEYMFLLTNNAEPTMRFRLLHQVRETARTLEKVI